MANLDAVTPRSTLSDYLHFSNGKTSPQRTAIGLVEVFGSNGSIGKADTGNFEGPVVIVGRVGSYCGSLHYSPDMVWVTDNAIACRPQRAGEARFWYFALQTLGLNGRSSGSGQPLLNQTVLGQIPFSPPETAERQAIAEVLGALDDKIAANTQLAAAVDEYLGAQFQREMSIGFESGALDTIAEVNAESVKPVDGGQLRYIDIASVGEGTHAHPDLTCWDEAPGRARRRVRKGDTLWSTVRPNRRSHSINLSDDPRLIASTGLAVLSPREVGFAYLYEATRLVEFATYLETVAEGSAYPAVRADLFKSAPVPLLSPDRRVAFEALAAPMREHVHGLGAENSALAELRDTLLPELISGRLRVKDAEAIAAEAGL